MKPGINPNRLLPSSKRRVKRGGFSLVELLVIVAIIAVLAGLLLPALSKAKGMAQRTGCLSNLRQLGLSWRLYSDENEGRLVESYPGNGQINPYAWVLGNNTNASEAVSPTMITRGKLFSFNNSMAIYRCPADRGVEIAGKTVEALRSYSMNAYMGSRRRFSGDISKPVPTSATEYVPYYEKETDLQSPAQLWVMLDEDERTISDGYFTFDPRGKDYLNRLPAASAERHNFGFGLNFADGHAEIWRFTNDNTKSLSSGIIEPDGGISKDFARLGRVTAMHR